MIVASSLMRWILRAAAVLLITTFCTAAHVAAQAVFDLNATIPTDPHVKQGRLPNGLTYFIRENKKPEKKAQLRLVVNAGSVLENDHQQGLAHFMEHMNFNGSVHFPKNELVSYLQSIGVQFGADLNAYTGFDETVYILPIPTDQPAVVDKGFTVLEDWAGNNLFDKAEIEKERGVVLEESRLGKGAQQRMLYKYFPRLLNGSRYAQRLPIGKDSIIKTFQPALLRQFYKDWYRPDLMAIIVVGDIDPKLAEEEIIKHFSKFKNPPKERPRPAIIPIAERSKAEAMVVTDKEATGKVLQLIYNIEKAKPVKTWGDYREQLKELLFSAMLNQRLNELTQKPKPPFAFANAAFQDFIRGYRLFGAFAFLGNADAGDAIKALESTIESVKKFGFTPNELERAKKDRFKQIEQAYVNRDKTESIRFTQEYVNHFLQKTPIPGVEMEYQFYQQELPAITLQEVNALSQKMEGSKHPFVLLMAPEKNGERLPTDTMLMAALDAAQKMEVKPYEEKVLASSLMDQMPPAGQIVKESVNKELGTTELSFSNGVSVTLRPTDFRNDEIVMDGWRLGGYHLYDLADLYNAQYAPQLVTAMGVRHFNATDLQKFLSGKKVNVHPYFNENSEGIEGSCSTDNFETFLQLIHLYLTAPLKEETLFKAFIARQKSFVQNILSNPQAFYSDSLTKILYNNSPWYAGIPRPEDFDGISLDRALDIYKQRMGDAGGLHFTFVGNIDTNKVKPLLAHYLGSLPGTDRVTSFRDIGVRPVKGVVEKAIYKGTDPKSFITIVFNGEHPYSQKESLKLSALCEVMNIKIIEKLREDMGGVYGAGMYGSLDKYPYPHYSIRVGIPCGPENVDRLTAAMFDLIAQVKERGPEQQDLDKVKATWKKQYEDNRKRNDYWLEQLSNAFLNKEDPAFFLSYEQQVDALGTQDIREAANHYLDTKNYVKVVLCPEKK